MGQTTTNQSSLNHYAKIVSDTAYNLGGALISNPVKVL